MERTLLCDLCKKYGTDKGHQDDGGWGYSPFYHNVFRDRRYKVKRVFELGICGFRDIPNNVVGASLWVWHDYFPTAEVIGVDVDPKFMLNTGRISSFIADETRPETMLGPLRSAGGPYDLIVDDAIHEPHEQIVALQTMIPFLAADGIYAMEDVCPSKLPNSDLHALIDMMPSNLKIEIIETHKPERLLLIRRDL